jgi:hypothetical protein
LEATTLGGLALLGAPALLRAQLLAGNVAFYTWPSLGCPSGIGWREEFVAVVGRPTTAVPRGKGRFAFVGMFPHRYKGHSEPVIARVMCPVFIQ